MIKRPLAMGAVVFMIVLSLLFLIDNSVFGRNPVKSNADGTKQLENFLQDDSVRLYGIISDYSYNDRFGQTTTELILTDVHIALSIEDTISWKRITRAGQNILVYINKEETLSIGETILLSGSLSFFEKATNPGQFDAEKYYEQKDTLFAVKKAVVEKRTGENYLLRQRLENFGRVQEEKLDYFLSEEYAAILKAMLFGNKKELDKETKDLYQDNGIAHILAISGLHISLLGMSIYRLLRKLPFPTWIALFGSELFLLLYGCMVGFSASAFRAIGMFTFFLISKITKRSYDMITAVAFVAILQLLIHPAYLLDCGFQLSYAAILGMAILLPTFQKLVKEIPVLWIQKAVSYVLPSLSVTLLTAPILIYHYHELSFFSIFLNIIVIPFVGILLLIAIAMLAIAEVSIPIAWFCTFPIRAILGYYEYSCRILERFPVGQKNIAHPSMRILFIYYGLLIVMTVWVNKKRSPYQILFPIVASFLLLFPKNPDFSIWMLDIGQGDCNVIFDGEGHCFVIDCGSTTVNGAGERRLLPFLKYHGIGKVDAVFITHADADHMNGVLELLELGEAENVEIGCVVVSESSSKDNAWLELADLASEKEIPMVAMTQGDTIRTKNVEIECLYPLKGQNNLEGNDASLVLSLEYGIFPETFSVLYTGDLEMKGEEVFLEEYGSALGEPYDLLKVGHHGSSGSSSEKFLEWVSPQCATISCGKNNAYGHPHKETLQRLKEAEVTVFQTPILGAMRFWTEKGKLQVEFENLQISPIQSDNLPGQIGR